MSKVTDFEKCIDDLNSSIKGDSELGKALKAIDRLKELSGDEENDKEYRLPYSSNPKPIGDRWR